MMFETGAFFCLLLIVALEGALLCELEDIKSQQEDQIGNDHCAREREGYPPCVERCDYCQQEIEQYAQRQLQ